MAGASDSYSRSPFHAARYDSRAGGGAQGDHVVRQYPYRSRSFVDSEGAQSGSAFRRVQPSNQQQRSRSNYSYGCGEEGHMRAEKIKQLGLVLEVHRDYGRVLCPLNFSSPSIHIFFTLATHLASDSSREFDSEALSTITDDLCDLFHAGDAVEVSVDGDLNARPPVEGSCMLMNCSTISLASDSDRDRVEPQLAPMLVIQEAGEVPLAMTARHELVALHPHLVSSEAVVNAFFEKKQFVTLDCGEWPEYAMLGRTVEGRILKAPRWVTQSLSVSAPIEIIAVTLQKYGMERAGFASVKKHIEQGIVLTPIDKDDFECCGDIFFPYEMNRSDSAVDFKKSVYVLGSKWYFRACRELPGRSFKYRAYTLDDVNGPGHRISRFGHSTTQVQNQLTEAQNQNTVSNEAAQQAPMQNSPSSSSSNGSTPTSDFEVIPQLVDVLSGAQVDAGNGVQASPGSEVVSRETMDLLSVVDFAASAGVNADEAIKAEETPLLSASPRPDESHAAVMDLILLDPDPEIVDILGLTSVQPTKSAVDYSPLREKAFLDAATTLESYCYKEKPSKVFNLIDYCSNPQNEKKNSNMAVVQDDAKKKKQSPPADYVRSQVLTTASEDRSVKKFHVLDENFDSTGLKFDKAGTQIASSNYAAALCGCSDDEDVPRNKSSGFQTAPRSTGYSHAVDIAPQNCTASGKLFEVNRNEHSGNIKMLKSESPENLLLKLTSGGKVDPSKINMDEKGAVLSDTDDDEPLEAMRAIRVERKDSDGWWFTRAGMMTSGNEMRSFKVNPLKDQNRVAEDGHQTPLSKAQNDGSEHKMSSGATPVEDLNVATPPPKSGLSELSSDNVMAKFFSGLI